MSSKRAEKKVCLSTSHLWWCNTLLKMPSSYQLMSTKANQQRNLKLSWMLTTKKRLSKSHHTQSLKLLSKMSWKRDSLSIKSPNPKKNQQLKNKIMSVRAMEKFRNTSSVSMSRELNPNSSVKLKRKIVNALMALAGWEKMSVKKCSLSSKPLNIDWRTTSVNSLSQ